MGGLQVLVWQGAAAGGLSGASAGRNPTGHLFLCQEDIRNVIARWRAARSPSDHTFWACGWDSAPLDILTLTPLAFSLPCLSPPLPYIASESSGEPLPPAVSLQCPLLRNLNIIFTLQEICLMNYFYYHRTYIEG